VTTTEPFAIKLATIFIYLVFPLMVVGFIWGGAGFGALRERQGNIWAYYPGIYQNRILLRSLAARREGNSYAYCSIVFWAVMI